MDLGVDLGGAAHIAEQGTASANGLSQAVEDAARAGAELAGAASGAGDVGGLVNAILSDWGAELNGAVGQAADSAQRLHAALLTLTLTDEELARSAPAVAPRAAHSHRYGQVPQ